MKKIKLNVEHNKLLPLYVLSKLEVTKERIPLSVEPDYDISTYEGIVDKEYYLKEEIDLSETYKYVFRVDLEDFGYVVDDADELFREKGSSGEGRIDYHIEGTLYRERLVKLKGVLFGNSFDIGSEFLETVAELSIIGVTNTSAKCLELYQELLLEGYLLELECNYKMSFFTYFTAVEAFVSQALDAIKSTIFSELHEPLERLPIDEKVRILAKNSFNTNDLKSIAIWGEFSGLLKVIKDKRNKIAHGKSADLINHDDVNDCFTYACILITFYQHRKKTFQEISKYLHPKL